MTDSPTTTAIPDPSAAPAATPPLVLLAADDALVCVDDACATLPADAVPVDDVPADARPGNAR